VPTIYPPIEPQDGGHASLCPPYCSSDLLVASADSVHDLRQINTTGKSLLIFRNRVKSSAQKYSAFAFAQISRITPPVSPDERGARERHERAVGCGGRRWRDRRARRRCTAKSCGSGVAVLALSPGEAKVSHGPRRQKSRSPGRARSKP